MFPSLYADLRRLAAARFANERREHTLQPTALVNEVYLQLIKQKSVSFQSRSHFMALSAVLMRRVLLEHARGKRRVKRGHGVAALELGVDGADVADVMVDLDQLLDFDAALTKLEQLDPRQVRVVELRFFGSLTMDETADVLGVSTRTAESDWHMARAWLKRELARPAPWP